MLDLCEEEGLAANPPLFNGATFGAGLRGWSVSVDDGCVVVVDRFAVAHELSLFGFLGAVA